MSSSRCSVKDNIVFDRTNKVGRHKTACDDIQIFIHTDSEDIGLEYFLSCNMAHHLPMPSNRRRQYTLIAIRGIAVLKLETLIETVGKFKRLHLEATMPYRLLELLL